MININKRIKITLTGYVPQFSCRIPYEYYNTNFYRTKMSLKQMYKNKYAGKGCICAMHSFKAVRC